MQTRITVSSLTSPLPSSATLLKLARLSRLVLRAQHKIFPDQLLRGVPLADSANTPPPGRPAVFTRLKNEAARGFFSSAFREVLAGQCRSFAKAAASSMNCE